MARDKFDPLDIMLQMMESELRLSPEQAIRSLHFRPGVDIYETETDLIIKVEAPGIKPEQLNITLTADDRRLIVSGERYEPTEEQHGRIRCYQLEIYYGLFEREIILPKDMRFDRNRITADCRDGFILVALPKRQEKWKIEVL